MSKARPPIRRRKPPLARRLRAFWLPIALVATLVIAGVTFAVSWSGFAPTSVNVVGNAVVPSSEILARAGIARNVNVWLQNTGAMATRIEAIPNIAGARIYRLPPAAIVIAVSEREPFAILAGGVDPAVVDRQLRVLQASPGSRPLPSFVLPADAGAAPGQFLTDAKARAMRDDYETMIAAHVIPLALEYDRYDGLVATMRGGVRVLLGDDDDLDKKLALVDPILAQIVRKQQNVAAVDLRAPRTPVLVFKR